MATFPTDGKEEQQGCQTSGVLRIVASLSGILPRIGAENQFYNKAFSTNDRLKSLCSKENVEFLNLWNHFYDQRILFNHDGLHLNPVGSARLGRLLSDAVEAHRTKNGE